MSSSRIYPLREDLTKVSYILSKADKPKLERAAKKTGQSMSDVISDALAMAGILTRKKAK